MTSEELVTQQTKNWIRSFVMAFNLCPFAKRPVDAGTLRIRVISTKQKKTTDQEIRSEVKLLDEDPSIETTLLVFPSLFKDFFDYLHFFDRANTLLINQGYEGIYQLASFHPEYCFADTPMNDVSNYTNRSPYPMIHILREESIEKAIDYYGDTSQIPQNNINTLKKIGRQKILKLLSSLQG